MAVLRREYWNEFIVRRINDRSPAALTELPLDHVLTLDDWTQARDTCLGVSAVPFSRRPQPTVFSGGGFSDLIDLASFYEPSNVSGIPVLFFSAEWSTSAQDYDYYTAALNAAIELESNFTFFSFNLVRLDVYTDFEATDFEDGPYVAMGSTLAFNYSVTPPIDEEDPPVVTGPSAEIPSVRVIPAMTINCPTNRTATLPYNSAAVEVPCDTVYPRTIYTALVTLF